MFGIGILENIVFNFIKFFLKEKLWRISFFKLKIIKPDSDLRISFSALLKIHENDKYLLIKNLHRPEIYSPIGGVIKYFEEAKPYLDKILFRPQVNNNANDMSYDLRGFIPRKNLIKLILWYHKNIHRELPQECIMRELKEELDEIGVKQNIKIPQPLHFRFIRREMEGPDKILGKNYMQVRIFEVFELYSSHVQIKNFINRLFSTAKNKNDLLIVSSDEIIKGRGNENNLIGHHAGYLMKNKRVRCDEVPIN